MQVLGSTSAVTCHFVTDDLWPDCEQNILYYTAACFSPALPGCPSLTSSSFLLFPSCSFVHHTSLCSLLPTLFIIFFVFILLFFVGSQLFTFVEFFLLHIFAQVYLFIYLFLILQLLCSSFLLITSSFLLFPSCSSFYHTSFLPSFQLFFIILFVFI